ncbi:helix-turn-helix domain-containing protein [Mesorhizobium sp. J428]|uniref:helix-turn-helix domain-containing protein n=1 Tax=Mesorhizobium sp. J428 TaxID=2898440 RepID=UPI0021509087|nr:helix-turn-helix domain-containing protein [Mesorhizobium sp. J428]MCR5856387.1 helix-turn-helix domain-containing protein [Mesorhizobium sp. J428]
MTLREESTHVDNLDQREQETVPRCRANSPRGNSDATGSSYQPVKAVSRALMVLRCLNELQHGSIAQLHRMTGYPKPTIVRALETLMSEGYAVRDNFSRGYRTTSQVQALSRGFNGVPLLIEAARVQAIALTERIKWPVSIGTVVDGKVVVNFSTAPISPYGFPFPTLNRPFSITETAIGRCYLAFCEAPMRERLLDQLARTAGQNAVLDLPRLRRALDEIRKRGYALQDPFVTLRMFEEAQRFQFMALPIRDAGECIACLGVGFYKRAVRREDVDAVVVAPARETVASIEANVRLLKRNVENYSGSQPPLLC